MISESLSTLLLTVTWEVEDIPNELGDLAKAVSTQSVEECLPLTVKCEKQQLKKELLNEKEPEFADFEFTASPEKW